MQGFASVQGRLNALIKADPLATLTHDEKALFWNNRHFLVVRAPRLPARCTYARG